MGKQNVVTKKYMQNNARFADVCNFYLFDGEQVIKPEDLIEKDVTELALPKGLKGVAAVEKVRDILRGCCVKTANGVTYLIVGIENQTDKHYAMVVRNMLYDALNYASQVETLSKAHRQSKDLSGAEFLSGFTKDDTLHPVITLTIFWNYGNWEGPRSLHEMLDVADKDILNYVADYRLNLIVPEEIKDFDKFKTELSPLLEFINCAHNGQKLKKALREKGKQWEYLSNDAVELLNICLDAKLQKEKNSEEGVGNNVCRGIRELQEMSRTEGKNEGKIEGEERLNNLMCALANRGYQLAEILSMISDAEKRAKLYEEYGIA